ncbi:metallophosphoesterase family protein [Salana multivorans]|uniref:metallophosphoesterase family protein n=1 Tax=Salana multivorans TaxID=120377 RepID=UPI000F4D25B9|nr:metallophosphoesterase family protein [Salana multivorans]
MPSSTTADASPGPTPPPDAPAASPRRRGPAWWHAAPVWVRRTVRQLTIVGCTGVIALLLGVFTASATTSLGPHEARIATNVSHVIRVDLGPLGSLEIPSPAPWPLGVQVDVGEIPATLTEVENPLQSLSGDVAAYAAFFADPRAGIEDAALALVNDAARRTVLVWSLLLVAVAIGQLAAGGLLRREVREKLRRAGVAPLAATTALAVLAVPLSAALTARPETGRPSAVLSELGGPLAEARVSGQVAALLDSYGERALEELRKNDEFYAELATNVRAAYAEDAEPLAPRRPLAPVVPEPAASETPTPDATESPTADVSPTEDATETPTEDASPTSSPSPSPSPSPTRDLLPPDPVTLLVISDNHCNMGMGPVFGELARQSQADVILNAGDSTLGGSSVESICIDQIAKGLPADVPVVVADGNHDSSETSAQEAKVGWRVLDGGVIEVEGLTIVGNVDSRLTSVTLGNREYATRGEAAQVVTDAACAAVGRTAASPEASRDATPDASPSGRDDATGDAGRAADGNDNDDAADADAADDDAADGDDVVDILLLHDPYTGARVMQSGCVGLEISGHLHRRVGPTQQGLGVVYLSASSGGAKEGSVPIGPLQADAYVTVISYDRANHVPLALREITLGRDRQVTLGEWEAFPVRPTEPVTADLSVEAWPNR